MDRREEARSLFHPLVTRFMELMFSSARARYVMAGNVLRGFIEVISKADSILV